MYAVRGQIENLKKIRMYPSKTSKCAILNKQSFKRKIKLNVLYTSLPVKMVTYQRCTTRTALTTVQ